MTRAAGRARGRKPSATQVRALQSIAAHGNPGSYVVGSAAHGGAYGTQRSIVQRGWARCTPSGVWYLTPAGKALIFRIRGGGCCG